MWMYMGFAIIGADLIIADSIVGCSILPSILIFALSDVFQFCLVHKLLTGYSLVCDILINANRYIGLGTAVFPLKLSLFIIGGILFLALLIKIQIARQKNKT